MKICRKTEEELIRNKYIYKITNKINNKCYIGQTNNYKSRFKDHKGMYDNKSGKILCRAFKKYGIDNFKFEVIDYGANYNELEIYYIKYYNSINHGYNISPGGENPPIKKGENGSNAKHTQKEIDRLKDDLKNTDKSFEDLAIEYKYKNKCTVQRINSGESWRDDDIEYPIRKISNEELVDNIMYMLKNTSLTQKEISKQLNVKRSTVTMTNIGDHNRRDNEIYPIREDKRSNTKKENFYDELIEYIILHPKKSLKSISEKFGISRDKIQKLNKGYTHKNDKYEYPLRKKKINTHTFTNPVTTIPLIGK